MSVEVKRLLDTIRVETTHEERVGIDKEIEKMTGVYCDKGVKLLTMDEFRKLVRKVKNRMMVIA